MGHPSYLATSHEDTFHLPVGGLTAGFRVEPMNYQSNLECIAPEPSVGAATGVGSGSETWVWARW